MAALSACRMGHLPSGPARVRETSRSPTVGSQLPHFGSDRARVLGRQPCDSPSRRVQAQGAPEPPPSPNPEPEEQSLTTKATRIAAEVLASPLFYLVGGLALIKIVASLGESGAAIFFFAAAPITLLTAISKTGVGKKVQEQLEAQLPGLQAEAEALRQRHEAAKAASSQYGPGRPLLPGPLGAAPHLQGVLPADQGFDPLGLGVEADKLAKYREAELLHARWAMLGIVGALVPEALALRGVELGEPVWWKVGASKLNSDLTLNWGGIEGFRIAGKQGIGLIAACQAVLMGGPEYARYVGIKSLEPVGVFLPGNTDYPGGALFDPFGYAKNPDDYVTQMVKELRNGRLAMLSMLGLFAQAAVTRKGPLQNALDFAADPAHNNIVWNLSHLGEKLGSS